ncbi:MAG: hypothetical protein IPG98_06390 [Burkholderiales bacterium]|nr:hypothetical protein [Burkholderiales bacterium]MBK8666537.1 hypothetical protein [Burkholderiales bacterium]
MNTPVKFTSALRLSEGQFSVGWNNHEHGHTCGHSVETNIALPGLIWYRRTEYIPNVPFGLDAGD